MMLGEMPSTYKKRDVHMLHEAKQETCPQPVYAPTPKDRLIVAIVSLVILLLCAVITFGAITVLHAGIIGWLAILTVIIFAVITINVVMAMCCSQQKHINERPGI